LSMMTILRQLNEGGVFPYVEQGKLKTKSAAQALTPELVALIKGNKDALIAYLEAHSDKSTGENAREQPSSDQQQRIPAVPRNRDNYPLSFAQQRLWVLDQLEGDGHEYNVNFVIQLEGELNIPALQKALDVLVSRHEILRTRYVSVDGTPRQVVDAQVSVPIRELDLSVQNEPSQNESESQQQQAKQAVFNEAVQPFDLAHDNIIRCLLIRLSATRFWLSFTKHHIASDGWSMGIINRELSVLYTAFVGNLNKSLHKNPDENLSAESANNLLPTPGLQYIDYAVWQRQTLGDQAFDQQVKYWQTQLHYLPMLHSLPSNYLRESRQRQSLPSQAGAIIETRLSAALLSDLRQLAMQQGVTLFVLLQSAFAALLCRWSTPVHGAATKSTANHTDIVMGTPVAGRSHADVEAMVGFFVNTLVLRANVDPQQPFLAFLWENQATIIDAFAHQDVPFDSLVEALNVPGKSLHSPLFQVMFALQNNEASELTLPGLTLSALERDEDTSKFELNLITLETDGGLLCFWNYATAVFAPEVIDSMAASFAVLLAGIAQQPNTAIGQLPLLSDKAAQPPLQIVDSAGNPLPIGAVGEIQTLAPHQAKQEEQQHAHKELGFLDANQQLHKVGAMHKRQFCNGYWLQLDNIEQVLQRNEYVVAAQMRLCAPDAFCSEVSSQEAGSLDTNNSNDQAQKRVAYLQLNDEVTNTELFLSGLHYWLNSHLPEYARPDGVLLCDDLSHNEYATTEYSSADIHWFAARRFRAPQSQIEQTLAAIWQKLLKTDEIGLDDNFFALGGSSLTAVRLEFELRKAFAIEVSINDIFSHGELEQLASLILEKSTQQDEAAENTTHNNGLAPIAKADRQQPLALSYAQQRLWFIDNLQGSSLQYNMQFPLFMQGKLDVPALKASLQHIVQRHEVLRTVYVQPEQCESDSNPAPEQALDQKSEQVQQQILSDVTVPVTEVALNALSKETPVQDLLNADAATGFDLRRDVMLRATLANWQLGSFSEKTVSEKTASEQTQEQPEEQHYLLLLTFHHIAFDGWSAGVFFDELTTLYNHYSQAKSEHKSTSQLPPQLLPPVAAQYADFSQWQRQQLSGDRRATLLQFWQTQLQDMPELHSLLLDYPRPSVQAFRGDNRQRHVSKALSREINALATRHDVTLFMLLETAFALFIARWSNSSEAVIGSPIAGRKHPDVAGTLGFFVNNLVLATPIDAEQSFTALLSDNKQRILSAFEHDDLPFELLVEVMQPQRSGNYNPLFQIAFALQSLDSVDGNNTQLHGLQMSEPSQTGEFATGNAKLDLSLYAYQDGEQILLHWNYDTALFAPDTIACMENSFHTLLSALVKQPESPVLALPMVDASQLEWLQRWQGRDEPEAALSAGAHSKDELLHHAFERFAAEQPEQIALRMHKGATSGAKPLSYGELNHRANILAQHLLDLGLQADINTENIPTETSPLVAVCLPRSMELVVSLLAIVKAGGAYICLDSSHPAERLQFILQDSQCKRLISLSSLVAELDLPAENTLFLDGYWDEEKWQEEKWDEEKWTQGQNQDQKHANTQDSASQLAYGIYTSGTTGTPKASLIPHSGIRQSVAYVSSAMQYQPGSVAVQYASMAFDASVIEMWCALSSGSTLLIINDDIYRDPHLLSETLREQRVTHGFLPPAMMAELIQKPLQEPSQAPFQEQFPDLNWVFTGGEAIPLNLAQHWAQHCQLFNAYGPSEASVVTSFEPLKPGLQQVTIGRPIDGTQYYVLNAQHALQPKGTVGELYIGGRGLAREYLNRPELTATSFIDHRFIEHRFIDHRFIETGVSENNLEEPITRLYKTGDLVRWTADGTLAFVGRVDDQVKLRGFRIELAEIEHKLVACEGVSAAVVLLRESDDEKSLAAFLVGTNTEECQPEHKPEQIQAQLQQLITQCHHTLATQLPGYMLPAGYALLPAIPRTPNGKTDKKALLKLPLHNVAAVSLQQSQAPETELEQQLHSMWAELLPLPAAEIGIDSDFFTLGGHSLLAARLSARIKQQLNTQASVRDIFQNPTIKALAAKLELAANSETQGATPLLNIQAAKQAFEQEGQENIPLSYAQQRLWLVHCLEGASPHYNLPFAFRLTGTLDNEALTSAFETLVQRHEVLRTVYDQEGTLAFQRVLPASAFTVQAEIFSEALAEDGVDALAEENPTRKPELSDTQLQRRVAAEALTTFDLSESLPIRLTLLRFMSSQQTIVLLTLHHIVADGWSIGVLTKELMQLYAFYREQGNLSASGSENLLPALPLQYSDYALWQRSAQGQQHLDAQRQYWLEQLQDVPVSHNLPLDKPRRPVQSFEAQMQVQPLGEALSKQVHAFANSHSVSVFMLLHSVFAVLLSRWSGESDIVIGTPVAGRHDVQLEPLIGCFINNVVLRSQIDQRLSFNALLQRNKTTVLDAFNHQDYAFDALVEQLNTPRTLSHAPVFQILLNMQNNEQVAFELPGVEVESLRQPGRQIKYDLNLTINEHQFSESSQLVLAWSFATSLFEPSTIAGMAARFEQLLSEVLTQPNVPVHQLNWLLSSDQQAWQQLNRTEMNLPRNTPVPVSIAEQMAQLANKAHADAIAVEYLDVQLSYRQLWQATSLLSEKLTRFIGQRFSQEPISQEPNTPVRVAILCHRQPGLIAAMLATWQAGASYVPIDPGNTPQRIADILTDANIQWVFTDSSLQNLLLVEESQGEKLTICLVEDAIEQVQAFDIAADLIQTSERPANIDLDLDSAAYTIYTSGSTGKPKGVEVSHRGLADYCAFALSAYYSGDELSGSLVAVSHAFDLSLPALLLPLMQGGTLNLMPNDEPLPALVNTLCVDSPANSAKLIRLTPSHVKGVLALLPIGFSTPERHVFVIGGENFLERDAEALQQAFPQAKIINHYGPTETVIGCTFLPFSSPSSLPFSRETAEAAQTNDTLAIGKPMANTKAYVLDEFGRCQPRGVQGELCIAGVCVTQGYVNRPDLTAERFIVNPFANPNTNTKANTNEYRRLYRTGDRVALGHDGLLHINGRQDQQIKLRGYRIEIGEIEAQLMAIDGIKTAAVLMHNQMDNQQLLAFIQPEPPAMQEPDSALETESETDLDKQQLSKALSRALPAYMVPSHFIMLDTLPLNANGKIDCKALANRAETALQELHAEAEALAEGNATQHQNLPANDHEQRLLLLWQEVLENQNLHTTHNFFEMGGNSLRAVQLTGLIRRAFVREFSANFTPELNVSAVMQYPTVRAMAEHLLGLAGDANTQTPVLQLLQAGKGENGEEDNSDNLIQLVLIHAVGGDLFAYSHLVQALPNTWRISGLAHPSFGEAQVHHVDIELLAAHYVQALGSLNWQQPVLLLGWSMGGLIAIEVARQLARNGRQPLYVGAIDSGFALPNAREKRGSDEKDSEGSDRLPWEALLADMREPSGSTKPIEYLYQQFAQLEEHDKVLFRSAYGARELSRLAGQSEAVIEQLLLSNLQASRTYVEQLADETGKAKTPKKPSPGSPTLANLHYMPASEHAQTTLTRQGNAAKALAQTTFIDEPLPGNHFSVMQHGALATRIVDQVSRLREKDAEHG